MHPFKLLSYDGSGSLDTFLTKFQHMASYLHWDEDVFHHLCTSLEGAAGEVPWDIGPQATTADILCLLQMRFGTQLQVEHFKAESQARRRAPGESLQSLYQDISRFVTLAYPSVDASLIMHVGKEAFITALSDGNLQLEVMKRELPTIEGALSYAIKVLVLWVSLGMPSNLSGIRPSHPT